MAQPSPAPAPPAPASPAAPPPDRLARKHWTEYAAALGTIITPLLVAVVTVFVTLKIEKLKLAEQQTARTQAAENREIQVLEPLLPYLFGDDDAKRQHAIAMMAALGSPSVAAYAVSIRPDSATIVTLTEISRWPGLDPKDSTVVANVLEGLQPVRRTSRPLAPVPAQ